MDMAEGKGINNTIADKGMNKSLSQRNEAIEVLRFPLTVMVIFIHTIPPKGYIIKLSWNSADIYTLISEVISHHLGQMVVPCFFLLSGYFFFRNMSEFNLSFYGKQLQRRLKSLLIPYVIWNLIAIVAIVVKNFLFEKLNLSISLDEGFEALRNQSFYHNIWKQPINFPLWYIRDLICMSVLSPLFYIVLKHLRWIGIVIIFIVYIIAWELPVPGLSTTAFMFFALGAILSIQQYDLVLLSVKYGKWTGIIGIILFIIAVYFAETVFYKYIIRLFVLFTVPTIFCIGSSIIRYKRVKESLLYLSTTAFFIYALHEIYIINWLKGAVSRFHLTNAGYGMLIGYFIIPVICVFVCLKLYDFTKRFFPVFLAISTGGRVLNDGKSTEKNK